jgi:AmmeMemoRadiSam system protein B
MPSGSNIPSVRSPAVAGSFYPASPEVLRRDVDEMLERAEVPSKFGALRGLVAPHAGYQYSGFTAAHSYKLLKGTSPEAVIIVSPSHREYFEGISLFPGSAYQTPLGDVPVNQELSREIADKGKGIAKSGAGHRAEHAIEVQLPFLQRVLGSFTFVPIVMGVQALQYCRGLAEALATVVKNRNIVLVASSDLSHYHTYDEAVALDHQVIARVEEFDPVGLMNGIMRNQFEACGGGPIAAVMLAAKMLGANTSTALHYCNSGDTTRDKDAVVGYLSAMITGELSSSRPH